MTLGELRVALADLPDDAVIVVSVYDRGFDRYDLVEADVLFTGERSTFGNRGPLRDRIRWLIEHQGVPLETTVSGEGCCGGCAQPIVGLEAINPNGDEWTLILTVDLST